MLTSGHSGLNKDAVWLPDTWGQKQLLHYIIISAVFPSTKWTEHHDEGTKVNCSAVTYFCVTCCCNIQLQETFVCVFTLEYVRYTFYVWAVRCYLQSCFTNNWHALRCLFFFWWNTTHSVATQRAYSSVNINRNLLYLTENCKILTCNVCRVKNLGWADVLKNEWLKVSGCVLVPLLSNYRRNFLFLWTYLKPWGSTCIPVQ